MINLHCVGALLPFDCIKRVITNTTVRFTVRIHLVRRAVDFDHRFFFLVKKKLKKEELN